MKKWKENQVSFTPRDGRTSSFLCFSAFGNKLLWVPPLTAHPTLPPPSSMRTRPVFRTIFLRPPPENVKPAPPLTLRGVYDVGKTLVTWRPRVVPWFHGSPYNQTYGPTSSLGHASELVGRGTVFALRASSALTLLVSTRTPRSFLGFSKIQFWYHSLCSCSFPSLVYTRLVTTLCCDVVLAPSYRLRCGIEHFALRAFALRLVQPCRWLFVV